MRNFISSPRLRTVGLGIALLGLSPAAVSGAVLWELGQLDRSAAEFALAPGGYRDFKTDAFYVVGESAPGRDWPYVQPGPDDAWAGGQPHTFTIRFALSALPASGKGKLELRLLDTHAGSATRVRIDVNGDSTSHEFPRGGGDGSISGNLASAKAHSVVVEFDAARLRSGDNDIHITSVGGSWFLYDALRLEVPEGAQLGKVSGRTALALVEPIRALRRDGQKLVQPLQVTLNHHGAETDAVARLDGGEPVAFRLKGGRQVLELSAPAVDADTPVRLRVEANGQLLAEREVQLKPVRHLTMYILPHSHTDIGYTEIQSAIEEKQVNNLMRGMELARQTANYPAGSRFVWNVEVLWAADLYLRRLGPEARRQFLEAVRAGQVSLNGMYLNELTGLCRPEELVRLFRMATELGAETGVPVRSAMISDVPGYTWGTVTAMAQAGIRYFSTAPNYFDRIGDILQKWENRPFYWVSPSGKEKVLVWIPWRGYALSHIVHQLSPRVVEETQQALEQSGYPYDIAHIRWSGHGDNAVPDLSICEFVRDWNARYEWPRFIISSTAEAFEAFEKRHGASLPEQRGDWTPYWEDGAGSSSLETALNRASSDRVSQAEALWAMLAPTTYPGAAFEEAWRSVLLYSEHTWGAWCSVGEPARQETLDQWSIKRSYAAAADMQSRDLLERAAALESGPEVVDAVDLHNTTSWTRTGLVVIPRDYCEGRDRVTDDAGVPVASQRLANGELVVWAKDLPPFAARRYTLSAGAPHKEAVVVLGERSLDNGLVHVALDAQTGALVELRGAGLASNLVDAATGRLLNDYLYFRGADAGQAERNGPVKIRVKETGPLVASLVAESEAPGCHQLVREVRVVAGQDYVELLNLVDKARLDAASYHSQEGKESLNFSFPFAVPEGQVRLEVPFGVMCPDTDQIPSACKNWFTVGRWADVANSDYGVTWVTLDAPLVQVGGLTANLLNSQSNPDVWRKQVGPTQRLDSWAMNNHWGTNYRAYQEGPVLFRFLLRPHRGFNAAAATRLAVGQSQPIVPIRARGPKPASTPRLQVASGDLVVTALKPSADGQALIARLWCAADHEVTSKLTWSEPAPVRVSLSDTSEKALSSVTDTITVPAWGLVTVRAELPRR